MKTLLHSFGFFVFSCLLVQSELISQCTPDNFQEVFIHPDSTIIASLIIEDAAVNDLSDPTQGVCGVKMNFVLNSVKEIEVRLVSPGGQSIDLIGPISPNGSITFNPRWDISFLPCTETATPDAGFSNPWTNTDNWAGPQTYTGSYHPYQECLENIFNTGPVNGLWSLEILNDARFDDGELISFELEFCNNTFDCEQCFPSPGSFDIVDLPVEYCLGSSELDFDFENILPESPDGYGLEYYVLDGDEIIEVVNEPNLSDYGEGSYQICALSYYLSQEADLVDDNSFNALKAIYNSAQSPVCAEFTETCFSFEILPYTDTLTIDTTICLGSEFEFNEKIYDTQDLYQDQLGEGPCDTLVIIDLKTVELRALISNDSNRLTCDNERIELGVGSPTMTADTEVLWRTEGGSIEGDLDGNNVFATQAGRYWLVLSEGGCADSFSIEIIPDTDLPVLDIVVSDTLDCNISEVDLIVTSTPAATSYQWSGPESGLPDDQNIRVSTPGEYSVTVSLPSGCSSIASHLVESDFTEPELNVVTTDISCVQAFGTAEITNIATGITYSHVGGEFNASSMLEYVDPGEYSITAMSDNNGCTNDTIFNINSNIQAPNLTFEPVENIDCGNLSVDLVVNSDLDIETWSWTGPDGRIPSDQNNIRVSTAGDYRVVATATNGCDNDASETVIAENTDQPSISLSAGTIDCNMTSVEIITNADQAGLTYQWIGPNGYSSSQQNPIVNTAGKYYLNAMVSDNCEIIDSITVEEDITPPVVDGSAMPITCANLTSTLTIENQQANVDYIWIDPDGITLTELAPEIAAPGEYILRGIGTNGCTDDYLQVVSIDTIKPLALAAAPQTLMCDRTQVRLSGDGSSAGSDYIYAWSTTDGSIMADANTISPLVTSPGIYSIVVTDQNNGCTSEADVLLEETRSDISDFEFEKFDPPCSDVPLGRIEIGDVTGGDGPYTYSADGLRFQDEPILEMLSAQVYTVIVKDASGCEVSKNVIIEEGLEVSVDLEDSYEINLGDELTLESILNTNGDPLRSIEWSLENQSVADAGERIIVRPLSDAVVEVTIMTLSGCSSTTSSLITVSKEKDIYTPNTISVSDFGENGSFKVYPSNAVEEVLSIGIYDRWGNEVFAANNYDPHTDSRAWDGTHNSQNLLPGIYVYVVEVLLIDGEQRVIPGEVLLVR